MPITTRHELTPEELWTELPWDAPHVVVHITIEELRGLLDYVRRHAVAASDVSA